MDTFIADLKSCVREAKESPSGKGTMVAVYGMFPFIIFLPFLPFVFYEYTFRVIWSLSGSGG